MNCQLGHNLMQLELDGELAAGQVTELQDHCRECVHCRSRREQLRIIRTAARGLAAMTAPAEKTPLVFNTPRPVRRWWPVPIAAAAGIALLIGSYLALSPARHAMQVTQWAKTPTPSQTVAQKPSSTPAEAPSLALRPGSKAQEAGEKDQLRTAQASRVEVEIDDPNVITVPYKTNNPKVTILWIYPKVELAATAKALEPGRLPS